MDDLELDPAVRSTSFDEKMLTQRLHEAEDHGLVEWQPMGAHHAYRLSARGESLRPVFEALYALGTELAETE